MGAGFYRKGNDIGYLVKKLTYNNKFSIKIFEVLTGLKLPKTNKDIEKFLNGVNCVKAQT